MYKTINLGLVSFMQKEEEKKRQNRKMLIRFHFRNRCVTSLTSFKKSNKVLSFTLEYVVSVAIQYYYQKLKKNMKSHI